MITQLSAARVVSGTAEFTFPYTINGLYAADFDVAADYTVRLGRLGQGAEILELDNIRVECVQEPARLARDEEGDFIREPNGRLKCVPAVTSWQTPDEALLERIHAWLATRKGQDAIIAHAEGYAADIG